MLKRITYITLLLLLLGLLGGGIWLYMRYVPLLRAYRLDGVALIGLIMLGVLLLIMPFHLRVHWDNLSVGEMIREVVLKGGLMLGAVLGVGLVLLGIGVLVMLPIRLNEPWLFFPWLFFLVPLAMVIIDFFKHNFARTPANFGWGFLLYSFQIYGLIIIQFSFIPIAFALFPAGFFLQFLGLVDFIMRLSGNPAGEFPMICTWTDVPASFCPETMLIFHGGHLVLAVLAGLYGERAFNKMADYYAIIMEWLAERLKPAPE